MPWTARGSGSPVSSDREPVHSFCARIPSRKRPCWGRFREGKVAALRFGGVRPFGVKPRSVGQQFLQGGPAAAGGGSAPGHHPGTGGHRQDLLRPGRRAWSRCWRRRNGPTRKILVCRPNAQFDADIGFLPGSEPGEDLPPSCGPSWTIWRSCWIWRERKKERRSEEELRGRIDYLFDTGVITAEAMNFMRGRSITDTWLVIDEAQNLTPRQVKGIINPGGEGHQGWCYWGIPGPERPPPVGTPGATD